MGWKGTIFEGLVWAAARAADSQNVLCKSAVTSIFVLRNNDLGDLLVTTPLFEALRRGFPDARIIAGVGTWAVDILRNNPYISEIVETNAPWHNKFVSPHGLLDVLTYIAFSSEVRALARRRVDVGVDVFGSAFGSLLMMRAGIPYRIGVKGFRGGHRGVQAAVAFDSQTHVSRANLRVAELLGISDLPEAKPQIYLTDQEVADGRKRWEGAAPRQMKRVIIAPGAGLAEKCWPVEAYAELARMLYARGDVCIILLGGAGEVEAGETIMTKLGAGVNLAGKVTLRETFSIVSQADLVVCNSSMLLHAAAAFRRPIVTLLGPYYTSSCEHEKLWSYPDLGPTLGRAVSDGLLPSVSQVADHCFEALQKSHCDDSM